MMLLTYTMVLHCCCCDAVGNLAAVLFVAASNPVVCQCQELL